MTWPEVKQAMAAGKRTVILACASTEQHGPHLPTGTDTYLGTAVAERAARIAGNALVAPTLRPGLSEHHMAFPGSFTLRPETFLALLEDYCESLMRHGFERIVIFASHGGNGDIMRAHTPTLARRFADKGEIVLSQLDMEAMFAHVHDTQDIGRGRAGAHAGYVETCMMLEHAPHVVAIDRAEPGLADESFYEPERLRQSQIESFLYGIQTQSPNGILGDPVGATAEVGDQLLQIAAETVARDATAARRGPPATKQAVIA